MIGTSATKELTAFLSTCLSICLFINVTENFEGCTAQKVKFPIKDFFSKCDQIRITFTKEILNEKLHFLCNDVFHFPAYILLAKRLFSLRAKLMSCWQPHPCCFFKNVSSKERVKLWFLMAFNIMISDMFPENFIEIFQVVQKIWRLSLSILAYFINFHRFFGFFDVSLLQRN